MRHFLLNIWQQIGRNNVEYRLKYRINHKRFFYYLGILEESDRQTTCVILISAHQALSNAVCKIKIKIGI